MSGSSDIPGKIYTYGGGDDKPIYLDAFFNNGGLITIAIDEETWIEVSPTSAKALVAKINIAMKDSVDALLSRDE